VVVPGRLAPEQLVGVVLPGDDILGTDAMAVGVPDSILLVDVLQYALAAAAEAQPLPRRAEVVQREVPASVEQHIPDVVVLPLEVQDVRVVHAAMASAGEAHWQQVAGRCGSVSARWRSSAVSWASGGQERELGLLRHCLFQAPTELSELQLEPLRMNARAPEAIDRDPGLSGDELVLDEAGSG